MHVTYNGPSPLRNICVPAIKPEIALMTPFASELAFQAVKEKLFFLKKE